MGYSIETYDLTKKFAMQKGFTAFLMHPFRKDEITAVEKVSIEIGKGELFGVHRPNGAGKTTLIKLLCTLILPTEGTEYVNGYNIAEDSGKVRESTGFITADERSFSTGGSPGNKTLNFSLLFIISILMEDAQQSKIGSKRKASRALNPKRSKIFSAKSAIAGQLLNF